jgi:Raf kinase inhibitor-like YbhB/YbcL family protein
MKTRADTMNLVLTSTAYEDNGSIPQRFTCQGEDVSPPLSWSGVPDRTKSLALIVDDPDAPDPAAPKRTWVHWVLYNIPANAAGLAEHCGAHGGLPQALDGVNDWGKTGYGGPCPPIGRHRYFHKLYSLDIVLPDLHRPDKARLLAAIKGHVLAEAVLIGGYQKS